MKVRPVDGMTGATMIPGHSKDNIERTEQEGGVIAYCTSVFTVPGAVRVTIASERAQ